MTKETQMTYFRPENHFPGKTHTCPCCLRLIKTTGGSMVRHGWRETGRRVGHYGYGYQSGRCGGVHQRPLEVTDEDALGNIVAMREVVSRIEDKIALYQRNEVPSFQTHIHFSRGLRRLEDLDTYRTVPDAKASGVVFECKEDRRPGSRFVSYEVMATVPLGFPGSDPERFFYERIPSYIMLRDKAIKALEEDKNSYLAGIQALTEAVETFRSQ